MMQCVIPVGGRCGSCFTSYMFRLTQHGNVNVVNGDTPFRPRLNLRLGMRYRYKVRIGVWNFRKLTNRSRELAKVMKRRKVIIYCIQETKCKEEKSKEIGEGYKVI